MGDNQLGLIQTWQTEADLCHIASVAWHGTTRNPPNPTSITPAGAADRPSFIRFCAWPYSASGLNRFLYKIVGSQMEHMSRAAIEGTAHQQCLSSAVDRDQKTAIV